jgi:hypothetical protein
MPSIFVWQCNTFDNTFDSSDVTSNHISSGNDTITYYSGSNWFMHEYSNNIGCNVNSYMYMDQYMIENGKVLVYNVVEMPVNWVGSDCLEIAKIPYKLHKKDQNGQLDQLGSWMRFISKNDSLASIQEFEKMKQWMSKTHN